MAGNQRFSITPATAAEDKNLSDAVFRTLACLGVYGDKNGWCWPALATIAEMRGVSKARISQDIKILIEHGYVQKQKRFENNIQITNKYRILFDRLTPEVNPPLTPEVNPPLTPEVNQNAPLNAPLNENKEEDKTNKITFAELSGFYCDNVELLTKWSQDYLFELFEEFGGHWVIEASKDAITLNRKNLKYIHAILNGWKRDGFRVDTRKGKQPKKSYDTQPKANRPSPEEW